jgi:Xaa-Pro aminopeptidase
VAREVRERLVAEGHDAADFAIVGSGPNSASPHHDAGERVIGAGEPIVLDIGGPLGGYGSDTTRVIWVTGGDPAMGPSEPFLAAFAVLSEARAAATAAVRPGVTAESIDAAARDVITAAGFGELFIHRTGHGIGLEAHEDPYIVAGSSLPLEAGMAFSIEPGIYREGEWGMRLEDIVVCGSDGADVLNRSDLDLRVVSGL